MENSTPGPASFAGASASTKGASVGGSDDAADAPVHDAEFDRWKAAEEPSTYRTTAGTDLALALGMTPVSFGALRLAR